MTADEFELLTADEAERLLRHRLTIFLEAGATPSVALVFASKVDVPESAVLELLRNDADRRVA